MSKSKKPYQAVKDGFIFKFYDDEIIPSKPLEKIPPFPDETFLTGFAPSYEPMRKHRFYVVFPEVFNIPHFTIRNISRPSYSKNVWENIKMDFIDLIGTSTSQGIMNMVRHCSMNSNSILFRFNIQLLDPVGSTVQRWDIDVSEIIRVDFGDLNYDDEGLTTCSIELRPQNCILRF